MEKVLLSNKFFGLSIHALVAKIQLSKYLTNLCDGVQMAIFCVFFASFAVSRVQHISDLHYKFALKPHHV